jgi:hypothetical protein
MAVTPDCVWARQVPLGAPMPVHVRGGQIVPRQPGGLTTAAGFDEGLCHYAAPYPFCMDNPYRYSKCQ